MGTTTRFGRHFDYDKGVITFFGYKGMQISGDSWAINWGIGRPANSPVFEINKVYVVLNVRTRLEVDVENGDGDRLAILLLEPKYGVMFFLDGGITASQLDTAVETDDYIDIPNVNIDGHNLTVRIMRKTGLGYATADSDGKVL